MRKGLKMVGLCFVPHKSLHTHGQSAASRKGSRGTAHCSFHVVDCKILPMYSDGKCHNKLDDIYDTGSHREESELLGEGLNDDVYERSSDEENVLIREDSMPLGSGSGHHDDDAIRK